MLPSLDYVEPALAASDDWSTGCCGGLAGLRFDSLNYSSEPSNGTFLRFLPARAGLLFAFSRWIVLPDFWDRYGMALNSSRHASVI